MFSTPMDNLFWVKWDANVRYSFDKDNFGSIVTPKTVLETSTDIQKYNYLTIDLMKKVNETAFVGVFEGKCMAVQHVNGTGNKKLTLFERQIFNSESYDLDCQDIVPALYWHDSTDEFFNRMYLFCDPVDPSKNNQSLIYTIIDGSEIAGPFRYDIPILSGRTRGGIFNMYIPALKAYSLYLLQWDSTLWDAERRMVNFRQFGFNITLGVSSFNGIKSQKVDFMSDVFNIYPRGNKLLIYGIYDKKTTQSIGNVSNEPEFKLVGNFKDDKKGKQVLMECKYEYKTGFICSKMISFHDTSIYLGFDGQGNHLDIYFDGDGQVRARNYKFPAYNYKSSSEDTSYSDTVLSFSNFHFNVTFQEFLKTNYIWDFDISDGGLRLRFNDKKTHKFTFDWVSYRAGLGNGPKGFENQGFKSTNRVELQDNWAYTMTNKQITRASNTPTSLVVNPITYEKSTVTLKAADKTQEASVKINFTPVKDPFQVPPLIPELPDFRISENTISTLEIPRSSISGNGIKFDINSDAPKEYQPTIYSSKPYKWLLVNPTPLKWSQYSSFGSTQLALVHQLASKQKISYYFCPPLGIYNVNNCYGMVTEDLPYTPSELKPYILPKPISLSGGRDYFITLEDQTEKTYHINWVNITYNNETKKFTGKKFFKQIPIDFSTCEDYTAVSNVEDGDGYILCSYNPSSGNGVIRAYRLHADGKGGIAEISRAKWADIIYKDVNGRFCPYQLRKSGRIGGGLLVYSKCPAVGIGTQGEEYLIVLGSAPESFTVNSTSSVSSDSQSGSRSVLLTTPNWNKNEFSNIADKELLAEYERVGRESRKSGFFKRLLERATKPLNNIIFTKSNSQNKFEGVQTYSGIPKIYAKVQGTITRYMKFYLIKTFHPKPFQDAGKPGYQICSLSNQYLVTRKDSSSFDSYDENFETKKTRTASELGLASISELHCDIRSNSFVIIGPDTAEKPNMQYVVFRGSTDRDSDDRAIVYKSERKGQNMPRVLNIQSRLVIFTLNDHSIPVSETVSVDQVLVSINTNAKQHPPVKEGSTYTVTAKTIDSQQSNSQSGYLQIKNIDHTLKLTQKGIQKKIGNSGIFFLDNMMNIDGPVVSTSLSTFKDHIRLSPRINRDKTNFLMYDNTKSYKDLQIRTYTSGSSYDVYVKYKKMYRAVVMVGKSLSTPSSIRDIDILYTNKAETDIVGFAVFMDGNGDCYLSKYETTFQIEKLFLLRTDGNCYRKLRVGRFQGSQQYFVFVSDFSDRQLHTFFIDGKTWTMKYNSPVRQMNVDTFDIIVQSASKIYKNGYKVENNTISVITKSGVNFNQLDYTDNTVHPNVKTLDTKFKFYARSLVCHQETFLCVSGSNNNVMYGIYPFDTTENGKVKMSLFEKFDRNFNLVSSNSNIAINSEFVAYLGIKSSLSETSTSLNVNVSVILYDVRTQKDSYKAIQMIKVQNFTKDPFFFTSPFGYVNLLDIELKDRLANGDENINIKSILSYNDGGTIWAKVRSNLFFNFTKGYEREADSKLTFKAIGINPNNQELVEQTFQMNKLFELNEPSLKWYYIVFIIIGGLLIIGGMVLLVFIKDESDEQLDQGDAYSNVFDVHHDFIDGNVDEDGLGFGTGIGSGFVGAGGGQTNPSDAQTSENGDALN